MEGAHGARGLLQRYVFSLWLMMAPQPWHVTAEKSCPGPAIDPSRPLAFSNGYDLHVNHC